MGLTPQEDGVLSFLCTSPPLTVAFLVGSSSSGASKTRWSVPGTVVVDPRAVLQLVGVQMVKLIGQQSAERFI